MVKYSALVLLATLALFWSSTEARENKYTQDVIDALTNWAIEELDDVAEPYKSRLTTRLNEGKNRHWDSISEYTAYLKRTIRDFRYEILRSKRHANPHQASDFATKLQHMTYAIAPTLDF